MLAAAAGRADGGTLLRPRASTSASARESEIGFYSATPQNYLAAHPQNVLFGDHGRLGAQERELFRDSWCRSSRSSALWPPLSGRPNRLCARPGAGLRALAGIQRHVYPWLHAHALPYRGLRVPARMAIVVGWRSRFWPATASSAWRRWSATALAWVRSCVLADARCCARIPLGAVAEDDLDYRAAHLRRAARCIRPTCCSSSRFVRPDISNRADLHVLLDVPLEHARERLQRLQPAVRIVGLHDSLERFPTQASIALLRRRGVTHVVVHGAFFSPESYDRTVARDGQLR